MLLVLSIKIQLLKNQPYRSLIKAQEKCAETDLRRLAKAIKNRHDAEQYHFSLIFLSCPTDIGQAGVTFFSRKESNIQ